MQQAFASRGHWRLHPANIDRDARSWLRRTRRKLGMHVSYYSFALTCKRLRGLGTEAVLHQ
eukprot:13837495-Alexandrium_andersonii.AAC.1